MKLFALLPSLVLALTCCSFVWADDGSVEIPGLPEGVKPLLILSDSFDREKIDDMEDFAGRWSNRDRQVANGQTIQLKDGYLNFRWSPKKHPLLAFYNFAEQERMKDVAVYAKFRLVKDDDIFSVGFNGDNFTDRHSRVCGISVRKMGFIVSDQTGFSDEHRGSSAEADIELNRWHTVYFVVHQGKATVRVNDLKPLVFESKGLETTKRTLKFGPSKKGFEIDELKVWSLFGK